MHDRRLGPYFPMEFRWIGLLLIAVSLFFLAQKVFVWPPLILLLGIFLKWASNGTQIDFENLQLREYVGVWGIKFGSWKSLPNLEKITITKTNYSQVLGSRGTTSQFKTHMYRGNLRGPGDFRVPFVAHTNESEVLETARTVADRLELRILDCTVKSPTWIT